MMCTGWLEKLPPEEKLGRYAWKNRWFILQRAEFSSSSQPLFRAGSAADCEDVYTFKAPSNTLCMEFVHLLVESAIAPPPQHHKTPGWGSPQQRHPVSDYKYPT
ncbi:GRB2-associated-binding protein 2 [Cricetulus griseus]|uniref:GRB2-associated-binding protein 2 n=1 Tax=Cricetulus griseus TaxID=10029 RepID=G3ICL1_CRIGR|nr:GRB2-associated-binding protein 2 [Cricetulus griseus]